MLSVLWMHLMQLLLRRNNFFADLRLRGDEFLAGLDESGKQGMVLFGRPYNAFSSWGNKSIPAKFATRGVEIIPCDMLPRSEECGGELNMYWATGEQIMGQCQTGGCASRTFRHLYHQFFLWAGFLSAGTFPQGHGQQAFVDFGIGQPYRRCRN